MSLGSTSREIGPMNDAGSLQNLNDIVVPGSVPWWPVAPGWYVLAGIFLAYAVYRLYRHWLYRRGNRYRKQALQELLSIRKNPSTESLQRLPGLIKRAALAVWPREQVAHLSGSQWHQFLDESAATKVFLEGAGNTLEGLAYQTVPKTTPTASEQVLDAAEFWLKNHQRTEEVS
jgi:hypothetical protein